MKLDMIQANRVIHDIDLRDPRGREMWKRLLHPPKDGTLIDGLNQCIAEGDEYLIRLVAKQVAERMSK